jgi:hypothetical protein
VVKRAKLAMLTEDRVELKESDLITASESAVRHLALLADMPPPKSAGDRLAEALAEILGKNNDEENGEVAATLVEGMQAVRARLGA